MRFIFLSKEFLNDVSDDSNTKLLLPYFRYNVSTRESTLIPRATQARTKNTPPQLSKTYNKMVRLIFNGVLKRVRFIFRSQNSERPTTKRYDLYFGAKILKSYDYSTRYDYSASAGTSKITVIWKSRILCIILERLSAVEEFWVLCNKLRRFLTSSKIIWNSRILCTSRSRIIVPCRMIVPFGDFGSEI